MSRESRMKQLLPHFDGSLKFAVFNCQPVHQRMAAKAVIAKFGGAVYQAEVASKMQTGIMEIFNYKPTRPLKRYAWLVALAADLYHSRRVKQERKAA